MLVSKTEIPYPSESTEHFATGNPLTPKANRKRLSVSVKHDFMKCRRKILQMLSEALETFHKTPFVIPLKSSSDWLLRVKLIMRTVTIVRNKGWYGRARTAQIMADNTEIGRIKMGNTVTVQIPEDANNLYAKMDWGRSLPYPVQNIKDGQTIYMNAWFTLNLLRNIGINQLPIALEDTPR